MAIAAVSRPDVFPFFTVRAGAMEPIMDTPAMVRPSAAAVSGVATAARLDIAVTLTVNGLARTLDLEPQMTLGEA
jgi:hypothetical protein